MTEVSEELKIAEPWAAIDDYDASNGPRICDLRKIERIGRISHRSEDSQTADSWDRFLRAVVIGHGDWSIVEHASATVMSNMDRGIQQELTRHRLFSYTIESTRFVNYAKKMPASFVKPDGMTEDQDSIWEKTVKGCQGGYLDMIKAGASPQIARSVMPLALASLVATTGNLRNWRHMFIMRTTKETHPQYRRVSIPLLEQFKQAYPILFDDIVPMNRQIDNLKLPR